MPAKSKEFYVLAHNIRSLFNVGSIFRTADAFGVTKLFLTGYTGTPANIIHRQKIGKVALGAEQWLPWEYAKSATKLVKRLKVKCIRIVGLENHVPGGVGLQSVPFPLAKFKPRFPLLLVLGEETGGIPVPILKLCDEIVEIPMQGKKESLNVSVAFGIAAYAISKKG